MFLKVPVGIRTNPFGYSYFKIAVHWSSIQQGIFQIGNCNIWSVTILFGLI